MKQDIAYGGFIVSRNVLEGIPIRYAYREKKSFPQLNGWTVLSERDDDAYVEDPDNFEIISASTMFKIAPVLLEIFDAPYGTDLFLKYKSGVHIGFYDLKEERDISIDEILGRTTFQE